MLRAANLYLSILAAFLTVLFVPYTSAQDTTASEQVVSQPYQKWLDEDVRYIITDQERAEFAKLTSDQQRDSLWRDSGSGALPTQAHQEISCECGDYYPEPRQVPRTISLGEISEWKFRPLSQPTIPRRTRTPSTRCRWQ